MCTPFHRIAYRTIIISLITNYVGAGHVSFNISPIDYEFDEGSNEYSYDSGTFESAEDNANLRRLCSKYSNRYVANRQNCNRFFVCGDGDRNEPLMGMCPPGLWFDPNHTDDKEVLCVYPEVLCATDHTDAYRYCNCTQHVPSFAMQANELAADVEMDPLIETSTVCVVDNELHLYASKRDCERYFACYNQKVFRLQCKPGMHFNAVNGYCDTRYEARCEVSHLRDRVRRADGFLKKNISIFVRYWMRNVHRLESHF